MSTLAKINGEVLSVPGLRFWGRLKAGRFLPLIRAGDSAGVLRELADWHANYLGGAS